VRSDLIRLYDREGTGVRNPKWTEGESILALDLYFDLDFGRQASRYKPTSPEIVALSHLLHRLRYHASGERTATFRNPNGVYKKLCNFLPLDPAYRGKGLTGNSRVDKAVWQKFGCDRSGLREAASAIRRQLEP
jgi:5-methylcytosine-specific restriction protein A